MLAILAVMFHKSLEAGFVLFSNDGPLGSMIAESESHAVHPERIVG